MRGLPLASCHHAHVLVQAHACPHLPRRTGSPPLHVPGTALVNGQLLGKQPPSSTLERAVTSRSVSVRCQPPGDQSSLLAVFLSGSQGQCPAVPSAGSESICRPPFHFHKWLPQVPSSSLITLKAHFKATYYVVVWGGFKMIKTAQIMVTPLLCD